MKDIPSSLLHEAFDLFSALSMCQGQIYNKLLRKIGNLSNRDSNMLLLQLHLYLFITTASEKSRFAHIHQNIIAECSPKWFELEKVLRTVRSIILTFLTTQDCLMSFESADIQGDYFFNPCFFYLQNTTAGRTTADTGLKVYDRRLGEK